SAKVTVLVSAGMMSAWISVLSSDDTLWLSLLFRGFGSRRICALQIHAMRGCLTVALRRDGQDVNGACGKTPNPRRFHSDMIKLRANSSSDTARSVFARPTNDLHRTAA